MAVLPSLAPAALLLLFAAWAGTFAGGATAAGAAVGQAAVLAAVVAAAPGLDPLRLGRAGRLLPVALWVVLVASAWASPVPRAGRVAVVLLPAFLALAGAVARSWADAVARRRGLAAVAAVVTLVSAWALLDWLAGGSPRPSRPLGHHNLLAVWLLALLPLAIVPIRERSPIRYLAALAGLLGGVAILASRSLSGAVGLALLLSYAALRLRRLRGLAALAAVVLVASQGPRLVQLAGGSDPSLVARVVYWRAGMAGFATHPILGRGPGSVPWTVGEFLVSRPGINPPGEVVGELHSLPLQLLYELGGTGFFAAVALAAVFARRRWAELPAAADPAVARAGLLGLAAAGVALLATAPMAVTAVPVALAVAAGAALAGGARAPGGSGGRKEWRRPLAAVYAALAVALLTPLARAERAYERAAQAGAPAAARRELLAAVGLDPQFPLYRAWLTWIGGSGEAGRQAAADPALEAAEGAPGVAALWLMAGVYGLEARAPWAERALERACRLDPSGPLAPFFLAVAAPSRPLATSAAARALLTEPRLLAATLWEREPELLAAAVSEAGRWPGVPAGWRGALADTAAALPPRTGPVGPLVWALDKRAVDSLSLHLFRRRPWTVQLAPVPVRERVARSVTLPPVTVLPETAPDALGTRGCGGSVQ